MLDTGDEIIVGLDALSDIVDLGAWGPDVIACPQEKPARKADAVFNDRVGCLEEKVNNQ